MNVDQQQQQQQHQQYTTQPAALLAPTNYHQYDATATATLPPQPPTSATYVTIGLMPQTGYNLNAATAAGATTVTQNLATNSATTMLPAPSATTPTSTFKTTPLLPMPTLEDIECGAIGAGVGGVGGSVDSSSIMIVSGAPDGHMLPPGILKYSSMPTPAFTTTPTMPLMALPTQLRSASSPPLPPPPQPSAAAAAAAATSEPTIAMHTAIAATSDTCGTLKSNNKLTNALSETQQRMVQTLQQTTVAEPPPPGLLGTSSTIPSNIAISSNSGSGSGGTIGCSNTSGIINNAGVAGNSKSNNSNSNSKNNSTSNLNSKRHKTKRKCCACFGDDGGHDVGGSDTASSKHYSASKKAKKTQTIWAGLLTNLGICALLLAYTLLGSFIFLTIENEDSSLLHLQRTLASTKRVAGVGLNSELGRGSGSESRNIYHTQPHHLDNGTVAAVSYSAPSSSSSSVAAATSSSSASQSASADTSAMNGNHEFGISDSQLALSAETYDVRQRTIENIWDITVSLNILYKENWTKLAALEIAKFQDQLVKRLNEDALLQLTHDLDVSGHSGNSPATEAVLLLSHQHGIQQQQHEWNFAKAFLYSLTVLTTIGYGNIAPKTTLGRLVTLAYAILGIPLTLVYLSSTGGILAKVAREVFSKALCCCMCSNCGYCCYDEKRMAEKERRMKRKRQQEELRKQQAAMQEPYYVRSGSMHSTFQSPEKHPVGSSNPMMTSGSANVPDIDSLSASESRGSMHGLSILAPILLCLSMMIIYILFGAIVLYRLEDWPLLDGIYFCFMSLSTIGFGDLVPGLRKESTTTTWFCSIYIMSGMALTAMCFNVIHEEIVHRIKIVVEFKKAATLDAMNDEQGYYMAAPPP